MGERCFVACTQIAKGPGALLEAREAILEGVWVVLQAVNAKDALEHIMREEIPICCRAS